MKLNNRATQKTLGIAAALLALPLLGFAQSSNMQNDNNSQMMNSQSAQQEAAMMVPANAALTRDLDAKNDKPGSVFEAKLSTTAHLDNGVELPAGTVLKGKVVADDLHEHGMSKLALCFTQAELKDGKEIPIKATIVGLNNPQSIGSNGYPVEAGDQRPNEWSKSELAVDQINALSSGIDLHSRISSPNSGVLVSTRKDNFKLLGGSEFQLAIAAHGQQQSE